MGRLARGLRGVAGAVALCGVAAVLAWPLQHALDAASLVLVFLLAVLGTAVWFGRGPALLAALLAVLLFNVMFVPPRLSLAVADQRFVFTLLVMLGVGAVVGQLTASLRAQADGSARLAQRTRHLYELARTLGGALAAEQVDEAVRGFAQLQWRAEAVRLPAAPAPPAERPDAAPANVLVLPLQAPMAVRGALRLQRAGPLPWTPEDRALAATCATLAAGALERIHYIDVAQATAVEVEGERLRNTLLAALSHDLRTPLASVVALAESLSLTRPSPTPEQAEIARAMAASARRMSAMVHNLLDLARLESGAVQLDLQWVPLEEVVGAALEAVGPPSTHPVAVKLADGLPLVRLDAVLLERVLVNLLENAFKYTSPGTPVEVRARADLDELELQVCDRGPGLPAGREEDLFLKFERGQRESATPGFGLGLALCRAIVRAHGGRIGATQAAEGGACVTIRLPLGQAPAIVSEPWPQDPAP